MSWSKDMIWGAASAAYQVEGAFDEDGKGLSIWDALSDGHVKHNDNGNIACDQYHLYKEDIALMKRMNLQAYRFSISWPRIMPEEGVINPLGVQYYKNLVEEIKKQGMIPMVTLYHWDLPMWMHEKGGWKSRDVVEAFAEYTRVVVDALSDEVTYWMTMNEAATFVGAGYLEGIHAPFERVEPKTEEFVKRTCILTKHVLLAHGRAVQIIRERAKTKPVIGIAMDGKFFMPNDNTDEAIATAMERTYESILDCHRINWWLDPICKGTYHPQLENIVNDEEKAVIAEQIDFIGYNCYKANNFDDDDGPNPDVKPGIPRTAMGWAITGDALYWAVRFIHTRYEKPIMITENGMANVDFIMNDGLVHDQQRIEFLKLYLAGLKRAADEGYPIIGYMYWSILDNFEWAEGYDKRFGLVYVNYENQERTEKDSAIWFANYIKQQQDEQS